MGAKAKFVTPFNLHNQSTSYLGVSWNSAIGMLIKKKIQRMRLLSFFLDFMLARNHREHHSPFTSKKMQRPPSISRYP